MTPYKNYSNRNTWTNRIKRGGLYVAVAASLGAQMSCGDSGSDWEQVTVYETTKGVVTTMEETEAGQFVIADEQVVDNKADSRVIVKHLNGKVDSLTLEQAKSLVQSQDTVSNTQTTHNYQQRHGGGIGQVLWWGSMGYMMGRSFNSPIRSNFYRDDNRRTGGGFYGGGYRAGTSTAEALRSTAVSRTEMRPVSGRSGFFKGWGRSARG